MCLKYLCRCVLLALTGCFLLMTSCAGVTAPAQPTGKLPTQQGTKTPVGDEMQSTDSAGSEHSGSQTTETTAPASQPDPPVSGTIFLTVNGTPISEFQLVCAEGPWRPELQSDPAAFEGQETEYDYLSAEKLAAYIRTRFSVDLPIVYDGGNPVPQSQELIVGASKRAAAAEAGVRSLDDDAYVAKPVSNHDYVVAGASYGVTWHAVDALIAAIDQEIARKISDCSETDIVVDLAQISLTGTYRLTTIGCVGDSITEGVGTPNGAVYSYPTVLQRLLWRDYRVINYGNSGKTMRTDLYTATGCREGWFYTQQYTDCLSQTEHLDIILLMLGTNDSNRGAYTTSYRRWGAYDTAKFVLDGKDLINRFLEKNADLTIYLMNCPAYYGSEAFGDANVRAAQAALYSELLAEKAPVKWVDMFAFTSEQLGESFFRDKLHPNQYGAAKMAKEIQRILKTDADCGDPTPDDRPAMPVSVTEEGDGGSVEIDDVFHQDNHDFKKEHKKKSV